MFEPPVPQQPFSRTRRWGRFGGDCLGDAVTEMACDGCADAACAFGLFSLLPRLLLTLVWAGPVGCIRIYQREISPGLPARCRYMPTCSEYAAQALLRHGALRGGWLAARRLLRCRPGGRRGPDPVP